VKIKRLEIIGFKSFVDKVSLEFPEGITAVVGPNGCGKSNIVDAIRWVMGEQSVKNLRGRQMEDVIFGGSEARKPLGMAEVSLIFSTDDGRVPAKYLNYSEIQVTRRLYRDGDSEYYLNKTPCRLMDIAELFMDTGVGARAYSIIEQGRIGMILLSKPEDRRFLIEEAAGVTKFKSRKQLALKKIEATRQNLVRIGDIVAEIKRQLGSLQRQAKKAERFRAVREELREIELTFTAQRHLLLSEERQRLARELNGLEAREGSLSAVLESGELAVEERRISLLEEEKGVTTAQEEIYRIKGEFQGCENRLEFQKKELLNLERHTARYTEELAVLERQVGEAREELNLLEVRRGEFLTEAVDEEQNLTVRERELEEMAAAERLLSRNLEEKRRELFALLAEIAKYNNQQSSAARRLEAMAERFERNRRERLTLREKLVEAGQRTEELQQAIARQRELKERLVEEQAVARGREGELRAELARCEPALQQGRDELNRKGSRLHSLQELEAQFAGYGQGVRTLMLSEGFKGRFRGIMADFLETGEEWEAALEAVLGERLQHVLAGHDADILDAVAFLKEKGGGRCSFIAAAAPFRPGAGVPPEAVPLIDRVTVADGHRHLVEPLLAGAFLVPDLHRALALSREFPVHTFVTRDGDLAWGGGSASGGSPEGANQGLIHKKREIKDLSRDVEALTGRVAELEALRERCRRDIAATEEELRELRGRQHQGEMQLLNHEKDLQRAREECQRLEERCGVNELEHEQLCEEKGLLEEEMAASGSERRAAEERQRGFETEVEGMNAALTEKRREIEAVREAATSLKVRVAALKEKRESALRACKRVEELVRDLSGRISTHGSELEKAGDERVRLVAAIAESETALRELLARDQGAEAVLREVRGRYEASAAVLREEEARLKGVRAETEEVRRGAAERSLKLSETNLQLHHLETMLHEKYRLDTALLAARPAPQEWDPAAKLQRQQELQRLVDEMGEVNLTAIDEYQELEERFTFLTAQKADLEESLQSLQQAIQRINRTTRKRFMETFELVNAKFREIFPRLFCGGRAELRLTEPENLLETGIDIIVQPPGKKLQNVTLLSGGEKALTAVALIFSIFLIKPSPFCLLDEVDAPLDDANIGRFNDMIREMTAFSQFILITHSKTTMAVADTLYGVTMEEPGVSKLVSVRLH
jgi:chromosome segregation protein